jgi:hypothetical protein
VAPKTHLLETPIYRSVSSYGDGLKFARRDRRPKHVPLLVDNVWEYLRPSTMPSRRRSAFGSPTTALAARYGPPKGIVCKVYVTRPCIIAQILGCPDASFHDDVNSIPLALEAAGMPGELMRQLSSALLGPMQIYSLMRRAPEIDLASAAGSSFWPDCRQLEVDSGEAWDAIGELFFEAPAGYALKRCS